MLPTSHHSSYQRLSIALTDLKNWLVLPNADLSIALQRLQEIRDIFQTEIGGLSSDELDPSLVSRVRSLQTEMYRALRLLETDLLFLRSSKQTTTSQQRLATISDRLDRLLGYCAVLLGSK